MTLRELAGGARAVSLALIGYRFLTSVLPAASVATA